MTFFVMYVLPLVLIGVTFALSPLRNWLEYRAAETRLQPDLVDNFQDHVAEFLRETDPIKHSEMREILRWSGQRMLNDGQLIRTFVLLSHRARAGDGLSPVNHDAESSLDSLSDSARHSFSRAMGLAFIISSYRAMFLGRMYRSMLFWILDSDNKEVKEPVQVIYRYRKARKSFVSYDKSNTQKPRFV